MSTTTPLSQRTVDYLLAATVREDALMSRLRAETAALPEASMQVGPVQGQFMALLVELMGARRALEVGVFTGASSLWVARALPEDGLLVACDRSEAWTAVARRYWEEAGVAGRIDLRLGPALETLDGLVAEGRSESFDFAFLDADKLEYDGYYERCLVLVRPGGLIALDNALRRGRVADPGNDEPETLAIRALNEKLVADPRVTTSLVPIGDGLFLARKR